MKNRRRIVLGLGVLLALALPSSAMAGQLTLHPSGFGEKSYAAWKAKTGEADTKGNDFQSLYFQKGVPTPTIAAGVAVIKGIEGLPAEDLQGLAWDHREDGHCGAGAPRWDISYRMPNGTQGVDISQGCNQAQHSEAGTASGHGWCRDEFNSLPTSKLPTGSTITGLAIVFDEGIENPNPPPPGCHQEQFGGGFVYLDNITVSIDGVPHVWTSADDNGNAQP